MCPGRNSPFIIRVLSTPLITLKVVASSPNYFPIFSSIRWYSLSLIFAEDEVFELINLSAEVLDTAVKDIIVLLR